MSDQLWSTTLIYKPWQPPNALVTRSTGTVHTSAMAYLTPMQIRDLDHHQNLTIRSLIHCQPSLKNFTQIRLTDNHAHTSSLIFTGHLLFLMPNQQCQSNKGKPHLLSKQSPFQDNLGKPAPDR